MSRAVGPSVPLSADFHDGPNGPLLAVAYSPPPEIALRGIVMLLPPFAEEMNRSRRMLAAIGRAHAMRGIRTVIPDLSGTGDSAGEHGDANWDRWLADIRFLRARVRPRAGEPFILSGIRTGALLAAESVARDPSGVDALLAIQPVTGGARFLQQFLRLRVAAAMGRGERETVGALMARLEAGDTLTISGYPLSPAMARSLGAASIADCPPPAGMRALWVEIGSEAPDASAMPSRLPPAWQAAGVGYRFLTGQTFWTLHDPVAPPGLVAAIAALAGECLG